MSENLVRPAVKALIENEAGEILVLKAVGEKRTYLLLPGGKVEYGETPVGALIREVKEEVSCRIDVGDVVGVYHYFADEGESEGDEIVLTVFEGDIESVDAVDISNNPADEGIEEYLWISPEELVEETETRELSKFISDEYNI